MSAALTNVPAQVARSRRVVRLGLSARQRDLLSVLVFWGMVIAYVVIFCAISLRRYDTFMMHALDMGNMEQAVWNTAHGHPFHFTNMRAHINVEAFGTDTRLSFHVEPILLPIALLFLLYQHPPFLLILQTLVLASGALALRRLACRHLQGNRLAGLAFPLAYLLFPAVQAANLYEFHPVTLTAALLLWALDFADERRPLAFALFGVAALCCKEEIGFVVALLALWSIRQGMPRRFALAFAAAAAAWTLVAVLLIVPAAQRSQHSAVGTSPYLARFMDRGLTAPGHYRQVTIGDVVGYWAGHPDRFAGLLVGPAKRGFVGRLLAPAGYLSLLSPLTLAISLPSFLLILLSVDQHMYGGVGHYSAELAGIVMASAVFGLVTLASWGERRGIERRWTIVGGALVLLVLSVTNTRANGFSPLGAAFEWPAITPHIQIGQHMLAMIPRDASVSAQDTLDPHLSDRAGIYLFPDTRDADYVALDVSASPIPARPATLRGAVLTLLASRQWDILFADDGYLLLHRHPTASLAVIPRLPPTFYSFAEPTRPAIAHPLRVTAGPDLIMLGYTISRREVVNLRSPDVILTTYWTVTHTISRPMTMTTFLTDVDGRLAWRFDDQAALAWLPITSWQPGRVVAIASMSMGIGATEPGSLAACVGINARVAVPLTVVGVTPRSGPYHLAEDGQVICLGHIPVTF